MSADRFILAESNKLTWVFPANLVLEIGSIEREKLLNLPFYSNTIIGCIHHRGDIITLVSLREIMGIKQEQIRQTITFIRLGGIAQNLAAVGVVVDKILASKSLEELPEELFTSEEGNLRLFAPEILANEIWQPVKSLLKLNS